MGKKIICTDDARHNDDLKINTKIIVILTNDNLKCIDEIKSQYDLHK